MSEERPPAGTGTDARGRPLTLADPADVEFALQYALRFDERGKPWRADLALQEGRRGYDPCRVAQRLLRHLLGSNYVVMQGPPEPPHGEGIGPGLG